MSKAKRAAVALAMLVVTGATVYVADGSAATGSAMADDRFCC